MLQNGKQNAINRLADIFEPTFPQLDWITEGLLYAVFIHPPPPPHFKIQSLDLE